MKASVIALCVLASACHPREDTARVSVSSDTPAATVAPAASVPAAASASPAPMVSSLVGKRILSSSEEQRLEAEAPPDGGLGIGMIQRVMHRNLGRIKRCYNDALAGDPDLAGTVAIKFVVEPNGTVSSATRGPKTTMRNDEVVACITRTISSLSFPPFHGEPATVSYPIS